MNPTEHMIRLAIANNVIDTMHEMQLTHDGSIHGSEYTGLRCIYPNDLIEMLEADPTEAAAAFATLDGEHVIALRTDTSDVQFLYVPQGA